MIIFETLLTTFWVSIIFEAAGAIAKISSSLTTNQVKLVQIPVKFWMFEIGLLCLPYFNCHTSIVMRDKATSEWAFSNKVDTNEGLVEIMVKIRQFMTFKIIRMIDSIERREV